MFRKIFSSQFRFAVTFKQGGQVSILFALLLPVFLLFLGVALDLGWYYLNVSRLQNAADAAAVAGAQKILTDKNNFSDYKSVALVGKYPGKVTNQYTTSNEAALETITEGKETAKEYASKNLSGNENNLVNSWTKNEVETEEPTLYSQDNNLYFVVRLRDTIRHFFLPGWFDDMDAPVTAVAMISKTYVADTDTASPQMPSMPSITGKQDDSDLPTMPSAPQNPLIITETFKATLDLTKNENVIVGNWEVQNAYKSNNTGFEAHFGYKVYDKAWNHLQDMANHYTIGDLYRKQTVNILDDVTTDGQVTANGIKTYASKTFGGNGSSVRQTPAAKNSNKSSTAYNPDGYPYLGERVDSLNIDFKPEVTLSGDWLEQDWDLTIEKNFPADNKYLNKDWASTVPADKVKRLRIHSSLNFDGAYKVRTNEEFLERDEETNEILPDILYVRIESEPILSNPDITAENKEAFENGTITSAKKVEGLNSVNQIIINANASNYDEGNNKYRPIIIFYDGPETNNIYKAESQKEHVRDSLPVILNLNKPFRGVLYAPNSPVVIIGDAKDNFKGFVVAKEYMRLKDDRDFIRSNQTGEFSLPIYYSNDELGKPEEDRTKYYKTTDENGIEMFVDSRGDIQFASLTSAPTRYGTYDNFDRTDFSTEGYKILQYSADNMLLSGK